MKNKLLLIGVMFALFTGNNKVCAQAGLNSADSDYDRWAYIDAIGLYEKVVKKGYSSRELIEKLGNAYYFNGQYADASKYYGKLFAEYEEGSISPEYFYRYAHTLQNIGSKEESEAYYRLFVKKAGNELQISKIRNNEKDLQKQILDNSGRLGEVVNLAINTPYSDYGGYIHEDQFYYTSAKDTGNLAKKRHSWTGDAFTNLYLANVEEVETEEKSSLIKGKVSSVLNESTAVLTKDGKTMYFTRNNILNGKRRFDDKKATKLKIFKAEQVNGSWSNITELPFNSDQFNTAHPALSPDEKILYFSSDRPGGIGQGDLWKVAITEIGYGKPENLGPDINTEARETFPFVSGDELYFSSNGRVGLGGLDVYGAKIKQDGSFGVVQNVGAPVNSASDDFAYYIDRNSHKGYFSSNREGGKGKDDIYAFTELKPLMLECNQELHIKVVDGRTNRYIHDATVTLWDGVYNKKGESNAYKDPSYDLKQTYECGEFYRIKAEREGYISQEVSVSLPNENGITEKVIVLEPVKIQIKEGDDLFKILKLNPIYFDLDKHFIRPDAAIELAKVQAVLEEYPNMKIDIRSHTDSRASHKYNEDLSSRRANATAEWLISKGIDRSRLTWKGYGETQLVNKCSDGIQCTEEEHQQNRRSEFIVTQL